MDIQPPAVWYDDDICISRLLNNSQGRELDEDETLMADENFGLELQLQEAMLKSFTKKALCEICAEIKDNNDMFPIVDNCRHSGYCRDCISKHVSIEVGKRQRVITCTGVGCTSVLGMGTCGEMVGPDVRRVWDEGGEREKGDLMLHDLAKEKKWQICPNCSVYVDKMDGCLHMTCSGSGSCRGGSINTKGCQFEFCYACGEAWSSTHGGCQ